MSIILSLARGVIIKRLVKAGRSKNFVNVVLKDLGLPKVGVPTIVGAEVVRVVITDGRPSSVVLSIDGKEEEREISMAGVSPQYVKNRFPFNTETAINK